MPLCKFNGCNKHTTYKKTKQIYCEKHLARIRRHGYPEYKKDAYQSLETLPHTYVDKFILSNCKKKYDEEIVKILRKKGYQEATVSRIKYRRRKLGIKKYLYGAVQKHKAWIRAQAIKKYGNQCELCKYKLSIDTHHIVPKHAGGVHEIDNLMILCPNCHALLTRNIIKLESRKDIPKIRKKVIVLTQSN